MHSDHMCLLRMQNQNQQSFQYKQIPLLQQSINTEMNQPKKIRSVYNELRIATDDSTSSLELLDCAGLLVDLFSESNEGPRCEIRTGGVPFDEWSLDKVFADGGWRVMGREYEKELELERFEMNDIILSAGLSRWQLGIAA